MGGNSEVRETALLPTQKFEEPPQYRKQIGEITTKRLSLRSSGDSIGYQSFTGLRKTHKAAVMSVAEVSIQDSRVCHTIYMMEGVDHKPFSL